MTVQIKKAGAYSAAAGVFVKKSGVYSAVQGMFVKVAGVYQNVVGFLAANAVFDWSRLSGTMPGGLDSSTGSASFWVKSNLTILGSYRTIFVSGRSGFGINDAGMLYVGLADSTNTKTLLAVTQTAVTAGHYAIEWDTSAAAGSKTVRIFFNGSSVPLTVTDASVGFVCQYQFGIGVGATSAGSNWSYADIGELMFWPGTFANWTTNISKVYAAGKPVDPGANGSTALGATSSVYLSVRGSALASTFLSNLGSGPALTLTGMTLQRADEAVISYGDSLTYGTGASYTGTYWTSLVCHGLNRPIKQANFGVGGETIGSIAARLVAQASTRVSEYKARIWTLEGGYNSVANGSASILGDATTMVNALLAADPSAKWIFIGIPNANTSGISSGTPYNTIISANAGLATLCGSHFLDLLPWLIANGLSVNGLTATANDLADIADGIVPRQLRSGDLSVHWNDYGHYAVAQAVLAKLQALGYD